MSNSDTESFLGSMFRSSLGDFFGDTGDSIGGGILVGEDVFEDKLVIVSSVSKVGVSGLEALR